MHAAGGHTGRQKKFYAGLAIAASLGFATAASAKVAFFTLPGGTLLTVEAMNSGGDITGEWTDADGNYAVYIRAANGTVTDYPHCGPRAGDGD